MSKIHTIPFALLGLTFLFLTACNPSKKIEQGNIKKKSARFLTKKMNENSIDYEWFNAKARIRYIDKSQNRSVKMTMRLQKDKAIWASISFLGIEAARILATPDSVKVLNRLGKEYIEAGFQYIEENTGVSVDFVALQDLLIGNPLNYEGRTFTASVEGNQQKLSSNEAIAISYFLNAINYQLEKQLIVDTQNKREVSINQEDYRKVGEKRNFSYIRKVFVKSQETGEAQIQIDFSRLEFDVPKEMPFNVPNKYKHTVY